MHKNNFSNALIFSALKCVCITKKVARYVLINVNLQQHKINNYNKISEKMKRIYLLFLLLTSSWYLFATDPIILHNGGGVGNHFDFPVPAVQPDVYYDRDNQEIIIVGTGNLTYYDVEIESLTTWNVWISTQVNGTYDTIDVSSLPSDDYVITIDTSVGISYEGDFTVY